jgi:hypothetical protein
VPPLFAAPPRTESYLSFEKELQNRERSLTDFVREKYDQLVTGARQRAAEYLLAAHAQRNRPSTEEFMLLADGSDLNPTMIVRWKVYLERTRKAHHPVFAPWHALADLPEKEFAEQAGAALAQFTSASAKAINPLVARALAGKPPRSLAEAAQVYASVLNDIDRQWQDALKQATAVGNPPPSGLANPAQEELRQVFYGPNSPPNVPFNPMGDLELLPDRPSQNKLKELLKVVEQWRATGPGAPPRAMVVEELPNPYEPRVFLRGNPHNLGEPVPRQFLGVLAGAERKPFRDGSGRLELARAIADRSNPLTARVLINRVWLHHFGAGLVRTPGDFGLRSDPPSHPELLDHLASYFMKNGWSIKKLHRLILLSAVYQQASDDHPEGRRVDPENLLLWKMNRRRLDFEATRDNLLAISGRLDRTVGGLPVKDILAAGTNRRTVYGFIDRLNLPGLFRTFDFPSPDATSPQRDTTTVAPQALFLMNNPFVIACARNLLQRPEIVAEPDAGRRIERLYHLLYGRPPTANELELGKKFVAGGSKAPRQWESYVQALLLANEFVFVD